MFFLNGLLVEGGCGFALEQEITKPYIESGGYLAEAKLDQFANALKFDKVSSLGSELRLDLKKKSILIMLSIKLIVHNDLLKLQYFDLACPEIL